MKYILVGIIVYFIIKRVFNIKTAVSNDVETKQPTDKHGGQYVDYEEVD
jgi:hypothetical protein